MLRRSECPPDEVDDGWDVLARSYCGRARTLETLLEAGQFDAMPVGRRMAEPRPRPLPTGNRGWRHVVANGANQGLGMHYSDIVISASSADDPKLKLHRTERLPDCYEDDIQETSIVWSSGGVTVWTRFPCLC